MLNFRLLITSIVIFTALAVIGFIRLDIDTDVVRSLPTDEKVIADALDIFTNHPIHDQIAIDIWLNRDDPDVLAECGDFVEKKLVAGHLFAKVGMADIGDLIPQLAFHIVKNLPLLFSEQELNELVAPRLTKTAISARIKKIYSDLSSMDGIGQAEFIAADPLGLKDLIMAKMALLAPSSGSRIYKNHLISADGRHLLVTAHPRMAGTDTASAEKIAGLINAVASELNSRYANTEYEVTLTPAGAYRAALDNERIIRRDVQLAIWLATAGIALLLIISFPRPLIGLLSLVPALAGIATALFVYSLCHSSISIMILGFGGAVISITVDHGIAYLLFLDAPRETRGREAAREVWAVGLMAVLTTIGAFTVLSFSGFPVFVQLGQFTALGIFFSFLFVHLVFPRIFPAMPAGSNRVMPLQRLVDKLFTSGKIGAGAAIIFALVMLFYARPEFNTNLSAMNTVSSDTLAADQLFSRVWGNISNSYLMVSGADIGEIQQKDDQLLDKIDQDIAAGLLASSFVPSMIFPGEKRSRENLAAWQLFWGDKRIKMVKNELTDSAMATGFAANAFAPFFSLLADPLPATRITIPAQYYSLLGIATSRDKTTLIQFLTFSPGKVYNSDAFVKKYSRYGKIFDPGYFSEKLGNLLFSTFSRMFVIIAVSITILLFLAFLSWRLTLITLLPVAFAYVATLGTLKILHHPLDIPGLMLSIVILGMGIDYSIFFVRAQQRYRDVNHPSYGLVRMAVFMAATSTLIGFGVLCTAEHSLLHSAGLTSLLGIGYSLLGAFVLLPPLLAGMFRTPEHRCPARASLTSRILARYRLLEAYPRMFARFKLKFDPMFSDLPLMLKNSREIKIIVDIGCGFGVPAAWCLESFPLAKIFAVDPDPERVRIAALATGSRGIINRGRAPEMPAVPGPADLILLLDMLHYLDDETIFTLFKRCYQISRDGALLVIRFVIIPVGRPSWSWHLEDRRIKRAGMTPYYRPAEKLSGLLQDVGYVIETNKVSATNDELFWLVGRVEKNE